MRLLKNLIGLVALLQLGLLKTNAFSLIGPFAGWQTPEIGYETPFGGDEFGGPRLRGDEYRKSTPVVSYGFDGSFAEFFGAPGMQAVTDAFAVYNALPKVSEMSENLTEFPLEADGLNPLAEQLQLIDLKTHVMAYTLGTLGLTAADRWVWSLRSRVVIGNTPFYTVANYNYDPISGRPSRYVNGTLYSYVVRERYDAGGAVAFYDAIDIPVDSASPVPALSSYLNLDAANTSDFRLALRVRGFGRYFTGISRDDAGGLRYLYRPENINFESSPADGVRGSGIISGGGGSLGSPWTIVSSGGIGTNTVGTGGGTTRPLVVQGVRAGVDKVTFVRVDTDPVLRVSPIPVVLSYPELVISNGIVISQIVSRTLARPDLLFSAAEGGVDAGGEPLVGTYGQPTYVNNGVTLDAQAEGPGVIEPFGGGYTFNKIGPHMLNAGNSDEEDGVQGFVWGTYDGSTNMPVVFPVGTRLQDIEDALLFPRGN
jgi:hypothetical protein